MPIVIDLTPSGPLKRQIIDLAFGDCAMAGYEFGRTPEEINDALLRLNSMMAEWPFNLLGFTMPDYGVGSGEESSGIVMEALNPVASHLALRICPMMGASLSPEAQANLKAAMARLHALVATVPMMPMRNAPRGAGNRSGFGPFINEVVESA